MAKRPAKLSDEELKKRKSERDRARYWANLEKSREKNKRYFAANKERESERCRAYREKNHERVREKARADYLKDQEYNIQRSRAYTASPEGAVVRRQWRAANVDRMKAHQSRWAKENATRVRRKVADRRAAKLRAMPPWVDRAEIENFYDDATRLTKLTGVIYEVDHIVPLKHPLVCGLHVPANLRVITQTENRSKGNRLLGETDEDFRSYNWKGTD